MTDRLLPGVVQCLGPLGCRAFVDLGSDPDQRGMKAIDHMRYDPAHVAQGYCAATLFLHIHFVTA